MNRMEIKTPHKQFVSLEANMADAIAYVKGMEDNGVVILQVEYFDNDSRVADIQTGLG